MKNFCLRLFLIVLEVVIAEELSVHMSYSIFESQKQKPDLGSSITTVCMALGSGNLSPFLLGVNLLEIWVGSQGVKGRGRLPETCK